MWPQHNCRGSSTTEWYQMKSSWSKVTQGRAELRCWWTDQSTLKSVRSFVSILWLGAQKFSQLLNNSQQGLMKQQPWSKSVSCSGWAWELSRAGGWWWWWWWWCGFGCYLYYWQMTYIDWDSARTKNTITILININKRLLNLWQISLEVVTEVVSCNRGWYLNLQILNSYWGQQMNEKREQHPTKRGRNFPQMKTKNLKANFGISAVSAWIQIPCCHNAKYQKQQLQVQTPSECRGDINY